MALKNWGPVIMGIVSLLVFVAFVSLGTFELMALDVLNDLTITLVISISFVLIAFLSSNIFDIIHGSLFVSHLVLKESLQTETWRDKSKPYVERIGLIIVGIILTKVAEWLLK